MIMRLAAVIGAALVGLLGGVALTLPHARVEGASVTTLTTWATSTLAVAPTTDRATARVTSTRTATVTTTVTARATARETVTSINTITPTPRTAESGAPETTVEAASSASRGHR